MLAERILLNQEIPMYLVQMREKGFSAVKQGEVTLAKDCRNKSALAILPTNLALRGRFPWFGHLREMFKRLV